MGTNNGSLMYHQIRRPSIVTATRIQKRERKKPGQSYDYRISGGESIFILKKILLKENTSARIIPYGLLQTGRHPHRSGNQHTCPCRLLPCHSPWRWPMRGIRSRRFHIRCTYRYQRLLPTRSLRLYVSFIGKKRVTIRIPPKEDEGGKNGLPKNEDYIFRPSTSLMP